MTAAETCIGVVNAGSSSIKFALYEAGRNGPLLFRGQVEGIGVDPHLKARNATGAIVRERRWDKAELDHRRAEGPARRARGCAAAAGNQGLTELRIFACADVQRLRGARRVKLRRALRLVRLGLDRVNLAQARPVGRFLQGAADLVALLVDRGDRRTHGDAESNERRF